MQLHLGQVQLGPHQANHGAQRQEAHSTRQQRQRGANDRGQHGGLQRGHHREPRQHSEGGETQEAAHHASAKAAVDEVTRRS